ncbi:MAG: DUF2892 domain-containing protein [Bacteroidota bacterium]
MKKNMGTIDRVIRILVAVVIIALYFMGEVSGTAAIVLLVFAVVFIATSLMSSCPLYIPFGWNTAGKTKE